MFDICKHCENEGEEPCDRCMYATRPRPYADNTIMLFDLFKKKEDSDELNGSSAKKD